VQVPYQGALVLDANGPYKDYGWAKKVREEIRKEEESSGSSARTRPGKVMPSQQEVEEPLKQLEEVAVLNIGAVTEAVAQLHKTGKNDTAGLLERLVNNNQIHAPPVAGVFKKIFGLLYFQVGKLFSVFSKPYLRKIIFAAIFFIFLSIPNTSYGKYPTNLRQTTTANEIIIAPSAFWQDTSLAKLANYRENSDTFDVAIVNTDSIYSQFPSTTPDSSIRNFLAYADSNWGGHLDYVLLVGDVTGPAGVPTHVTDIADDNWYTLGGQFFI
jgi:hypothetical protein